MSDMIKQGNGDAENDDSLEASINLEKETERRKREAAALRVKISTAQNTAESIREALRKLQRVEYDLRSSFQLLDADWGDRELEYYIQHSRMWLNEYQQLIERLAYLERELSAMKGKEEVRAEALSFRFESLSSISQNIIENKELLIALAGVATPIVQYLLSKREKKVDTSKVTEVKIMIEIDHKQVVVTPEVALDDQKLLEALIVEHPEIRRTIKSDSRIKVKVITSDNE